MNPMKFRRLCHGCHLLAFTSVFFLTGRSAYAEQPVARVFSGKGCTIAIDDAWKISSNKENANILKQAEKLVETNEPYVQERIDTSILLFSAIKERKHLRTISLFAMPAEASQKEMSVWDDKFCSAHQSKIEKAIRPAHDRLGFKNVIYDAPEIEIINGTRCFLLRFDYVDSHGVPSVTERRFFYLSRGTFVLTLNYDKILKHERETELEKILASFTLDR